MHLSGLNHSQNDIFKVSVWPLTIEELNQEHFDSLTGTAETVRKKIICRRVFGGRGGKEKIKYFPNNKH